MSFFFIFSFLFDLFLFDDVYYYYLLRAKFLFFFDDIYLSFFLIMPFPRLHSCLLFIVHVHIHAIFVFRTCIFMYHITYIYSFSSTRISVIFFFFVPFAFHYYTLFFHLNTPFSLTVQILSIQHAYIFDNIRTFILNKKYVYYQVFFGMVFNAQIRFQNFISDDQ